MTNCDIMPDVHTPEQRHKNMAAIRAKDTKPEIIGLKLCLGLVISYDSKKDKGEGIGEMVVFASDMCNNQ